MSEQSYRDPTHFHYFTIDSFDYFDPQTELGREYDYSEKKWLILNKATNGNELMFGMEKI